MKAKHAKTLRAIFTVPTLTSIKFSDIEALFVSLGATIEEGAGSRVSFFLGGVRLYFHRPHPGKEARRYQVEVVREHREKTGVTP